MDFETQYAPVNMEFAIQWGMDRHLWHCTICDEYSATAYFDEIVHTRHLLAKDSIGQIVVNTWEKIAIIGHCALPARAYVSMNHVAVLANELRHKSDCRYMVQLVEVSKTVIQKKETPKPKTPITRIEPIKTNSSLFD